MIKKDYKYLVERETLQRRPIADSQLVIECLLICALVTFSFYQLGVV